jgi:hypothetical protein
MFIFLVPPKSKRIRRENLEEESFFLLDLDNRTDLENVLGAKIVKRADNLIPLF